ncbi:MAG TPA: AarF/ABC1/UbiB kinase family protein [Hypericibacter adhaerens]|jgi:predicted unusual protein kinase regulating ubiquinone biosynthesis (AarF/ABC1/UbiB family)|uniref:ABC1 kinase family protein n=1 Tax=Hypericibacter adhaerens TaxID=2602016 RepID=UPI002CD30B0A|nr:AarF/ABC1/UbiB kinase family protein [Hypericibacter adhaerens]HWA45278.1 AarF/ABC1/UbiB kinase family protein [Hypericibacter adhaerens]
MAERKSKSPERNRLTGRVRRYAKVGTAVGGAAARLAGERFLGLPLDRARHAADLKAALGGLKGPLMKVAQLLSTIPDALPDEYAAELAGLQSNAPSMGWNFVKRRMAAELGPDWQKHFRSFEQEAAAAASLGQVHRALSLDGHRLACKLQYPDMASAVEADIGQLKLILAIYGRYDRAIDSANIHAEIAARLREELDYRREAKHMRLYGEMLGTEKSVHVPVPVPALSTERLLTMSWLEGKPLKAFLAEKPDIAMRNKVALAMFRAWYAPFYGFGVIHGDPHLGNYTVRADGSVNLLDFGCIRVFPPKFVAGVIDLYNALETGNRALAVEAYENWGFEGLTPEIIDVLNRWAAFVYGPLLEDRSRLIQEAGSGSYGREVAEEVHAELRRLGPVKPPREFLLMDRAAVGLGSVFLHLKAEVNWHRLFHGLIADFDVKKLGQRQRQALKAAGLTAAE